MRRTLPQAPGIGLSGAGGALLFSLAGLGLGSIGLFRPAALVVMVVGAAILGTGDLFWSLKREDDKPRGFALPSVWSSSVLVVFLIILFLTALNPTVFYDALSYHLALPRQYLISGSTRPFSWHPFSFFPSNAEILFGLGMAGGDLLAAQVIAAGLSLFTALVVFRLSREFVSRASGSIALFVFSCTLTFFLSAALVTAEPYVGLFSACALYSLCAGEKAAEEGNLPGFNRWMAAAGIFAGAAGGAKYTAWLTVILPMFLIAGSFMLWRRTALTKPLLLFSAGAFLMVCPWLVRNLASSGNPVMPVPVPGLFEGINPAAWNALKTDAHSVGFSGGALLRQLAAPWFMAFSDWETLAREFGAARFVGPLLWMGAPLVLLIPGRKRIPAALWGFSLLSLAVSLSLFRMTRFAHPGLIGFVALSGEGFARFLDRTGKRRMLSRLMLLCLGLVFLLSLSIFMKATANLSAGYRWPRLLGDTVRYLEDRAEQDPSQHASLPLQAKAGQVLPEKAQVLLAGETRFAYLERKAVAPSFLSRNPLLDFLSQNKPDRAETRAFLLELGFTHLLVNFPELYRLEKKYRLLNADEETIKRLKSFVESPTCRTLLSDERGEVVLCELSGER